MKLVNPRMPDGNQWRFACRACGNVKVADDRTHIDKGTFICGECLGISLTEKVIREPRFMQPRGIRTHIEKCADWQRRLRELDNTIGYVGK